MKHRLERVKEVIKRELSQIINREISFGDALVTVQAVDITPDLKQAHIFIGVIGNYRGSVLQKLDENRKLLQQELSKRVVLKYTPHLNFKLDESIERGIRVIEILKEIDLPEPEQPDPDSDEQEQ